MKPVRMGLIGMGSIACSHVKAIQALGEQARILAVAETNHKQAVNSLKESGVAADILEDYHELLRRPDIDLVDVCLPNAIHAQVTVEALQAGKTVLCEKPLACSLAEVDRVIEAVEATGKQAFSVFQSRYGAGVRTLQRLMEGGHTGKPLSATVGINWLRPDEYYEGWHGTWEHERGGCVLTCGIHSMDILLEVVGEPRVLFAQAAHRGHDIETEDLAQVVGRFGPHDAFGLIQVTTNTAEEQTHLKFVFEHLTAISNPEQYRFACYPWRFLSRDKARQKELDALVEELGHKPDDGKEYHRFQIEDVIRYMREGGRLAQVPARETRKVFELITKMYQSIDTGLPVRDPVDKGSPFYETMHGGITLGS